MGKTLYLCTYDTVATSTTPDLVVRRLSLLAIRRMKMNCFRSECNTKFDFSQAWRNHRPENNSLPSPYISTPCTPVCVLWDLFVHPENFVSNPSPQSHNGRKKGRTRMKKKSKQLQHPPVPLINASHIIDLVNIDREQLITPQFHLSEAFPSSWSRYGQVEEVCFFDLVFMLHQSAAGAQDNAETAGLRRYFIESCQKQSVLWMSTRKQHNFWSAEGDFFSLESVLRFERKWSIAQDDSLIVLACSLVPDCLYDHKVIYYLKKISDERDGDENESILDKIHAQIAQAEAAGLDEIQEIQVDFVGV